MSHISPIILPLPPTDNALRIPVIRGKGRSRHPELIKSNEYSKWVRAAKRSWESWKKETKWNKVYEPSEERQLEFEYRLFLHSRRPDIGNFVKATCDFLGGNKTNKRLYLDDHWVTFRLSAPAKVDRDDPRVMINPFPNIIGRS